MGDGWLIDFRICILLVFCVCIFGLSKRRKPIDCFGFQFLLQYCTYCCLRKQSSSFLILFVFNFVFVFYELFLSIITWRDGGIKGVQDVVVNLVMMFSSLNSSHEPCNLVNFLINFCVTNGYFKIAFFVNKNGLICRVQYCLSLQCYLVINCIQIDFII